MPSNLESTLTLFVLHNWPLIVFGLLAVFYLVLSILNGSRKYLLLFVGFMILTLEFEFNKHLFFKIKSDMVDLVFPPEERFRKYNYLVTFLGVYFPTMLKMIGIIFVSAGFLHRGKTKIQSV